MWTSTGRMGMKKGGALGVGRGFGSAVSIALLFGVSLAGCAGSSSSPSPIQGGPLPPPGIFDAYKLSGDVMFVHDPSIIRQGKTYYAFTTDPGPVAGSPALGNGLQIRCSQDKLVWKLCGQIFTAVPAEVLQVLPAVTSLWAPDVSYFNGLYHVYYAGSYFGTNQSVIGLVTTPTLDSTDPAYQWTDQGIVLSSKASDNYNAIDPNILVDTDATGAQTHIWMQYGSYWGGNFQREIDPVTGGLSTVNTAVTNLATRPNVQNNPIEGSSLVKKNGFYYLFASFDYCCLNPASGDNYKIAVGRSTSANGPFLDQAGTPMLQGGGTILLQGNGSTWSAPGGETVYIDPTGGDLIVFHALKVQQNYLDYLYVNTVTWDTGWPVIQP